MAAPWKPPDPLLQPVRVPPIEKSNVKLKIKRETFDFTVSPTWDGLHLGVDEVRHLCSCFTEGETEALRATDYG